MLMLNEIKKKICRHKKYKIIKCNKDDKYYICECIFCGERYTKPKAVGEVYS